MNIPELLKKLKIPAKKFKLYETALTHTSFVNENPEAKSYEKLEFLGDSIIGFFISESFFGTKNHSAEKKDLMPFVPQVMSSKKHFLASNLVLLKVAENLKLNFFIRMGKGLKKNKIPDSVMADCFEAFVGAIYLDLYDLNFIKKFLNEHLINVKWESILDSLDYKSTLQEFIQNKIKKLPNLYKCIKNNDKYIVTCSFEKFKTQATDLNKKTATKKAAKLMLKKLKVI